MKFNIWSIFLGFIITYLVFQIHTDINSYKNLKRKTNYLKNNFEREIIKQKELKNLMVKLEDKSFIEQAARAKLNLVKKGETAYKICQ